MHPNYLTTTLFNINQVLSDKTLSNLQRQNMFKYFQQEINFCTHLIFGPMTPACFKSNLFLSNSALFEKQTFFFYPLKTQECGGDIVDSSSMLFI